MNRSKDWIQFLDMEKHIRTFIKNFKARDGINLWPLLRNRYQFFGDRYSQQNPFKGLEKRHIYTHYGYSLPRAAVSAVNSLPKNTCIIFAYASTFCEIYEGKLYNPYTDQVHVELSALGLNSYTFLLNEQLPLQTNYPTLSLPLIQGPERTIFGKDILDEELYKQYYKISEKFGVTAVPFDEIISYYLLIKRYIPAIEFLCANLNPKIILYVNHYNNISYAFNIVARKYSIPTVDIQHGCQDFPHMMYNIQHVPDDGFSLLPEYFFFWGKESFSRMQESFVHQKYHKLAIAGKANYIAWKNKYIQDPSDIYSLLLQIIKNKKAITVALPIVEEDLEDLLVRIVQASPKDWLWFFRKHPLESAERMYSKLACLGKKVEYSLCNHVCLHTLLHHSCHVVTNSSSTLKEAISLHNLHGTVISEYGFHYYQKEIQNGTVVYANTFEGILDHCMRSVLTYPHSNSDEYITQDTTLLKKAISDIVNKNK